MRERARRSRPSGPASVVPARPAPPVGARRAPDRCRRPRRRAHRRRRPEGHGQEAFLDALRGAGAAGGSVTRLDGGAERAVGSLDAARRNGIAYVPRERGHAVFAWISLGIARSVETPRLAI